MSEPVKMKPCPFCGGDKLLARETPCDGVMASHVRCRDCGACSQTKFGRNGNARQAAVAAWNRRVPPPETEGRCTEALR